VLWGTTGDAEHWIGGNSVQGEVNGIEVGL